MAINLREPVCVWDVAADDTAHVQQFRYQIFEMDNGDRHETGVVNALSDAHIRDILEECHTQYVIPVMMLLKHTEGHFYGVQHGQTISIGMLNEAQPCGYALIKCHTWTTHPQSGRL